MKDYKNYPFVVRKNDHENEDAEYVVIFNDFKNIIGSGKTVGDAIEEAYGNLEAYFEFCDEEGIEIPNPSQKDLFNSYSGKVTVRMPKSLHRDMVEYANEDGISLNSLINDAIRLYLSNVGLKKLVDSACMNVEMCAEDLENQIRSWSNAKFKSNLDFPMQYSNRRC